MTVVRHAFPRIPTWLAYLAVGAIGLGVHALLETGTLAQSFLYDVIGASAVAVAVMGVWRHRPDRVAPWLLMAFGQGLFVAGDLTWNYFEIVGEDPFPSVADVLYLGGYPFIALGLFLLIRRRIAGGDRGGLVDAAILTTAVAILSWTFLMQPQVVGAEIDALSLGISLAYPIADLLLIGVAMGLLTTPGARTVSFRLLGVSLLLLLVADQVYALQNLEGSYVSGGPVDTVYLVSYLLFGASALHPSMRRLTDPHPVVVTWLGPVRLVCLAAAMVTGPLLVTFGPEGDGNLLVVAAGTAVLSLLVLMRLAGLVGLLERDVAARRVLEARLTYQAYHDPLTELANRRRFVEATTTALASRKAPGSLAVLFLDVDDFKTVNDGLGHAAGDELLAAVADRIRTGIRPTDVAARLGGDEFGVLLTGIADRDHAVATASRLLDALQKPIDIAGEPVVAGASIGIALDTPQTSAVDDLLGQADIAMYRAKAQGKGRYHLFSPQDVLENEAAAGRTGRDSADAGRGRLGFRKPPVGRPAFGPEPG
ncbi:MAG TPA: GGDEF domain-containing protein [Candidatus Limnocylindrales bacterium]|jgi:diguanylate cyclase (GGDEF)-like protein